MGNIILIKIDFAFFNKMIIANIWYTCNMTQIDLSLALNLKLGDTLSVSDRVAFLSLMGPF